MDFKNEIPQRAWIDRQILDLAISENLLVPVATERVKENYGLEDYQAFNNPASVTALLYNLIVFPWSFLESNQTVLKLIENAKLLPSIFTIQFNENHKNYNKHKNDYEANRTSWILIRLRNAIAHSRIRISEKLEYEFDDCPPDGEVFVTLKTDQEKIMEFINIVGKIMTNSLRGGPTP